MPTKTLYIVQQFERQGQKLVVGRQMEFADAAAACGRAARDAGRTTGVLAVQQTVDTDTGEVLDEPIFLARHGELPAGLITE
jgi:NAD(P)H-hydrate repair Nnr-like enzyme with NAD(P)H-hydrate dehydratase domain